MIGHHANTYLRDRKHTSLTSAGCPKCSNQGVLSRSGSIPDAVQRVAPLPWANHFHGSVLLSTLTSDTQHENLAACQDL